MTRHKVTPSHPRHRIGDLTMKRKLTALILIALSALLAGGSAAAPNPTD